MGCRCDVSGARFRWKVGTLQPPVVTGRVIKGIADLKLRTMPRSNGDYTVWRTFDGEPAP
jgi:hypothetical protein